MENILKYRVWDTNNQQFIYPVIDITNDFYQNYPSDQFIFDKFICEKDEIEYYENDIIEIPFKNSKNRTQIKNYYALLCPNHIERGDWALYRFFNNNKEYSDFLIDNSYRTLPRYNDIIRKIGNIHQHLDLLKTWYLNQSK